jgi:DNA (cytosine-5)-methyltransferase 1
MNIVSLFSNVGIAETYLTNVKVANELLKSRAKFYQFLHPDTKMIQGDITDPDIFNKVLYEAKQEKCDFLLATPPCQGMSIAGKMAENDPRNSLIKNVVNFALKLKPNWILIENVPQVFKSYISDNGEKILITDYIKKYLFEYNIKYEVLDVSDYGTPQSRKRAFYMLYKMGDWILPEKTDKITVRDTISHLPSLESEEKSNIKYHYAKKHNDRHILWMKHTPTGKTAFLNEAYYPEKDGRKIKGFSTTYKRIDWDKPAPTITMANGSISSQNNVHPGRLKQDGTYSDARVLSLKEIFLLTGLPDDFEVPDWAPENLVRQVIGEGVPPKLIKKIIEGVKL